MTDLKRCIALSRRCVIAWNSGATSVFFRLNKERDELYKQLDPYDAALFRAWGKSLDA